MSGEINQHGSVGREVPSWSCKMQQNFDTERCSPNLIALIQTNVHSTPLPRRDVCTYTSFLYRNRTKTDGVTPNLDLRCTKAPLLRLLEGFSFPNLPNVLGNNFLLGTSIPERLISECSIWWGVPLGPITVLVTYIVLVVLFTGYYCPSCRQYVQCVNAHKR